MLSVITTSDPLAVLRALRDNGAVLLRDPDRTLAGFVELTDGFLESDPYHSVATRERDAAGGDGMNIATVNKGTDAMPLHRESSFLPTQPDVVALYCERAPAAGGQTTVCDGAALLAALPADVRRFLAGEELVWRFVMPVERWSVVFGSAEPERVSRRIKELMERFGPYATYDFRFTDAGELDGTYRTPFVAPTYWGNVRAVSTSLLYHYHRQGPFIAKHLHRVTLSGGRPVPAELVATLEEHADLLLEDADWRSGDVLLVDNSRAMHGRRAIGDPRRRILVRLGRYRPDVRDRLGADRSPVVADLDHADLGEQ
jgi:hypothetical protein